MKRIHFIGIGGIGMSALARYFLAQNWLISGSDITKSEEIKNLRKQGVNIKIGHKKSNIKPHLNLVVYSQAITKDNPEIKEAHRLNIPLKSYPEVLGELTRQYKTIAIAGSHGKSTATALTALTFIKAGLDPTVIIGTKLKELSGSSDLEGSNFRLGKSNYLIIEADEYRAAFLNYHPSAILITNIDREHLDFYQNLKNLKKTFLEFTTNLSYGGILVANQDNQPLASLAKKFNQLLSARQIKIVWFSAQSGKLVKRIKRLLKIPGAHNISNALGVFTLAKYCGIEEKIIYQSLAEYQGAWRRIEYKGKLKIKGSRLKIQIYDDYAHHPTEIKATISALKEKHPLSLLVCVFQPHQLSRLNLLFKEFIRAFTRIDILILLDVYQVAGRDQPPTRSKAKKIRLNIDSKKLAQAITQSSNSPQEIIYLPSPTKLKSLITGVLKARSDSYKEAVVVMMGAGDIVNLTPRLLK